MTAAEKSRLRLAWFSPWPDNDRSIAAYCSRVLLPELEDHFEITVFCDRSGSYLKLPVEHYLNAYKLHRDNPFALLLS